MVGKVRISLRERFEQKYERLGDEDCWPWKAQRTKFGHGIFFVTYVGQKPAHRVAYTLATGKEIPHGICICHTCDNPWCVNPKHLFAGTQADNCRDMREKGRDSKPPHHKEDAHPRSKLSRESVKKCRERYASGESLCGLAREFGLDKAAMRRALRGETWPEAGGPLAEPEPKKYETYVGSVHANSKLTEETVKEARARYANGERGHVLAKDYGVSLSVMHDALSGRSWKHVT